MDFYAIFTCVIVVQIHHIRRSVVVGVRRAWCRRRVLTVAWQGFEKPLPPKKLAHSSTCCIFCQGINFVV
jgi:hypothetical protein